MTRRLDARATCAWLAAAITLAALSVGVAGITYGIHWDESLLLESGHATILTGDVLPHRYRYPSLAHDLTALAGWTGYSVARALPGVDATAWLDGEGFHWTSRLAFLLASIGGSLAGAWALARRLAATPLQAFAATCILAGSYSLGYHARWMAPDGLLAAATAWSAWALVGLLRRSDVRRALVAGAWCGVATAAKHPGALVTATAVAAGLAGSPPRLPWRRRAVLALVVGATAVAVFTVLTPGWLLEARTFWSDLAHEREHYAAGHGPHTVLPGLPHLRLMISFLGRDGLSPIHAASWLLFAAAIVGLLVASVRSSGPTADAPRAAAVRWLAIFATAYVALFSLQRACLVRNLLCLLPLLAVAAVLPLPSTRLPSRVRGALAVALACVGVAGLAWQDSAARHLDDPKEAWTERFAEWAARHEDGLTVSPRVAQAVASSSRGGRLRVASSVPDDGRLHAWYLSEDDCWVGYELPSNHPEAIAAVFGPREADLAYYGQWEGVDRIVVVDVRKARAAAAELARALR